MNTTTVGVAVIPEEIKKQFENYRGEGAYERWFRRFERCCNTFTEIASNEGISIERVRQIYYTYFAPYLPQKSGFSRRRVCTLYKRQIQYERVRHTISDTIPEFKKIREEAQKRGWSIEAVPVVHRGYTRIPSRMEIRINGRRVRIYRRLKAWNNFIRGEISPRFLEFYDFCFFYIEVAGYPITYYIIPVKVIRDAPICVKTSGNKVFLLPLSERLENDGRGDRRKVDWRQYRDAWHLLEKNSEERGA